MSIPFNGSGDELNGTPGGMSFGKWVHVCRVIEKPREEWRNWPTTADEATCPDDLTLKEWQEWRWSEHHGECLGWSRALSNADIIWMHENKQ